MKNIVIVILLLLPFASFCQLDEAFQLSGKSWLELNQPLVLQNKMLPLFDLSLNVSNNSSDIPKKVEESILCKKYQGKAPTAFFCRMEDKLEHKVRFPIRMRLGTLDYVDHLEQKHVSY